MRLKNHRLRGGNWVDPTAQGRCPQLVLYLGSADFDNKWYKGGHNEHLLQDDRLQGLDTHMMAWLTVHMMWVVNNEILSRRE